MPVEYPIPVVDFEAFLDDSASSRKRVAKEIDNAFQALGFVTLKNHGITPSRLSECFIWSQRFFDLPEDIKALAPHPPGFEHHRGYSGLGAEKTSQHVYDDNEIEKLRAVQDAKEAYDIGNVDDEMQPNIWLSDEHLPGFRAFMEGFFEECKVLVERVLRALAIALELDDEQEISKTHGKALHQLRLLHYPSVSANMLRSGQASRATAHSDFGTLTLLFQDSCGGLEIEDPKQPGRFLPVTPLPDTVIINCGDLMERWSNGRWKSDVHRVVAPPVDHQKTQAAGEEILKSRYSIPFFAAPDGDTLISPLPGCWHEAENPKKYEPITAHNYIMMRMKAIR